MWPGQRAVIVPDWRSLSPLGWRNRRCPKPRRVRCRVTVRRLMVNPRSASSEVIRDADHLLSRRPASICLITSAGVAFGLRCGIEGRSRSPRSPWRRHRCNPLRRAGARNPHLGGDMGLSP